MEKFKCSTIFTRSNCTVHLPAAACQIELNSGSNISFLAFGDSFFRAGIFTQLVRATERDRKKAHEKLLRLVSLQKQKARKIKSF
jgi:hypothetical protein